MCVCVRPTMQLRVQFSQVGGDGGDEDLDGGVSRADLKTRFIGQHGQDWRHTEPVSQQISESVNESVSPSVSQ